MCLACRSTELDWLACSGDAIVHSYTIVRRDLGPAFETPHVVALVDLAEGPRLTTNLVGADADAGRATNRSASPGERSPTGVTYRSSRKRFRMLELSDEQARRRSRLRRQARPAIAANTSTRAFIRPTRSTA